jgi:WD40 repeat protein
LQGIPLNQLARSGDGTTIAGVRIDREQVVVIQGRDAAARISYLDHPYVAHVSVSPDGKWVATAPWHAEGVKVWNTATGQLAKELPGRDACVAFSPDGRRLVIGASAAYRSWEVGSWEHRWELPRDRADLPGPLAFSNDGKLLAIALSLKSVRIVEPTDGRELVTLTPPNPQMVARLCFSPDADRLAVAYQTHAVHLWDLGLIRKQLAEMNLDWN